MIKEKILLYKKIYENSYLTEEEEEEKDSILATLATVEMILKRLQTSPLPQEAPSNIQKGLISSDQKGWLRVMTDSNQEVTLAKYTRVTYHGYNNDKTRELFTILDWPNSNVKASVSAESADTSRFGSISYEGPGTITFDLDNQRLKYGNSAWIHAATDPSNPIAKGTHNLWLPDFVHGKGNPYLGISNYATIWYRIGAESSSRYLHVGNFSAGCVTVGEISTGGTDADKKEWNNIYHYLKKRRDGTNYVGKIKVI